MQTKAERMAMIREASARFQTAVTRNARAARNENPAKEDERYWTDASKYANQYYGETYRETTRFDNDWN